MLSFAFLEFPICVICFYLSVLLNLQHLDKLLARWLTKWADSFGSSAHIIFRAA